MNQSDTDGCIFSSSLKISYDRRFIGVAQDMVRNQARLAGANQQEVHLLTMLIRNAGCKSNMMMATVLVGFFCGPLLGGLAISAFGYTAFFLLASGLTALAALLMTKSV